MVLVLQTHARRQRPAPSRPTPASARPRAKVGRVVDVATSIGRIFGDALGGGVLSGRGRVVSDGRDDTVAGRGPAATPEAEAAAGAKAPGGDVWASQRLMAIAGAADRQAFAELFEWYAPRIKSFMMRGGTDADRAQEIAQEAMISVWRRAATFDPRIARPVTWIYAIARNRRIDLVRRDRRFETAVQDMQPLQELAATDSDSGIRAVETGDRVRISMEQLGADQLEVIRKAFFEEKSHTQIATELGLPLGTVKSRIRHALLRLRAMMGEDGR